MKRQGVIALVAVIIVMFAVAALTRQLFSSRSGFDVPPSVTKVRLELGSGDTTLQRGDRGHVETTTHSWMFWLSAPQPSVQGDTLVLGDCGWGCSADHVVTLPRSVEVSGDFGSGKLDVGAPLRLTVTGGSGDVIVRDAAGAVDVRTGSGNIQVLGVTATARVQTGSGNVTVDEAAGDLTAETGSGNITIRQSQVANVRAKVGSGNIDVTVPAGATYNVAGTTGSGNRNVSISQNSSAPHTLQLDSGSGNVTVKSG